MTEERGGKGTSQNKVKNWFEFSWGTKETSTLQDAPAWLLNGQESLRAQQLRAGQAKQFWNKETKSERIPPEIDGTGEHHRGFQDESPTCQKQFPLQSSQLCILFEQKMFF